MSLRIIINKLAIPIIVHEPDNADTEGPLDRPTAFKKTQKVSRWKKVKIVRRNIIWEGFNPEVAFYTLK